MDGAFKIHPTHGVSGVTNNSFELCIVVHFRMERRRASQKGLELWLAKDSDQKQSKVSHSFYLQKNFAVKLVIF